MLVLLFDIMEFGIVGGYLSKLCVTLPHMSIYVGFAEHIFKGVGCSAIILFQCVGIDVHGCRSLCMTQAVGHGTDILMCSDQQGS